MAEFPAMPLWTDAYLSDTRHLSLAEHGAYLLLLQIAWRTPTNAIPDNDPRIAQMLSISVAKWLRIKPAVMAFWQLTEHGWTQKRLQKVRENVNEKRLKCSKAANSKWKAKSLKGNGSDDADAHPNADADAYPTKTKAKDIKVEAKASTKKNGSRLPDDWVPDDEAVAFAKGLGHDDDSIAAIADRFKDHWRAQPGQRGVKLDWLATWRNWVRREGTISGGRKPPAKYVSGGGYEYHGSLDEIERQALRRGDNNTYWRVKGDRKRAAQSIGSVAHKLVEGVSK